MLYKANVPLILKGDYVKKGEQFEATPEEMAHYDSADFSPVNLGPVAPPEPEVEVPLEEMNKDQLQAKAKELGLATGGSKADLLERITLHLATETIVVDEEVLSDNI